MSSQQLHSVSFRNEFAERLEVIAYPERKRRRVVGIACGVRAGTDASSHLYHVLYIVLLYWQKPSYSFAIPVTLIACVNSVTCSQTALLTMCDNSVKPWGNVRSVLSMACLLMPAGPCIMPFGLSQLACLILQLHCKADIVLQQLEVHGEPCLHTWLHYTIHQGGCNSTQTNSCIELCARSPGVVLVIDKVCHVIVACGVGCSHSTWGMASGQRCIPPAACVGGSPPCLQPGLH